MADASALPDTSGRYADRVARLEAPNIGARLDNDSRKIAPKYERRLVGQQQRELAVADFGVEQIEPGGLDFDQHLIRTNLGSGHPNA